MATVAISSFWIHEMRWIGPFGAIHLLSLFVVGSLPLALLRARRGDSRRHAAGMTGLFTFWPGGS